MHIFASMLTDGGLLAWAAVIFGITSLGLAIAQLVLLRKVNLVPAMVGAIAVTVIAGLLGQATGLMYAYESLGAASPEERSVLLSKSHAVALYPLVIGLFLSFISAILCTVAATIRANLKPRPAPEGGR